MFSKTRDVDEANDIKVREAVRKAKIECDEEWKDRMRVMDRRAIDEADELRNEIATLKRRLEEAQRDADLTRRKIGISKIDGKQEALGEIDALKGSIIEMEEAARQVSIELRKAKDENVVLNGKVSACSLQVVQANAEADAAKAASVTALGDTQINSSALGQATVRIQQIDTECAQLRAENTMLRRENETKAAEVGTFTLSLIHMRYIEVSFKHSAQRTV